MPRLICALYISIDFNYVAYIVDCVGNFLMNYVPALVLFDSGEIRSFVSSSFCPSLIFHKIP